MTHDLRPTPLRGTGPWAHIDTSAITHNLRWARERVQSAGDYATPTMPGAPGTRLWAVVKADAYGHGMSHAVAALAEADGLCVASFDDVLELRQRGWKKPILLLSIWGLAGGDLLNPSLGGLHIVVDDALQLQTLEALSGESPRRKSASPTLHAWLRAAGRLRSLGFDESEYRAAFKRLGALVRSGVIAGAGHLHHYAASDDPQALSLERQSFFRTIEGLDGPQCTGNSAALCGAGPGPISDFGHWLRCGLLLYGASAVMPATGAELGLRPAMSLHARLLNIRPAKAGVTVGYGDSFRVERDTFIGTVGIGYGHGVPRHLWRRGHILAGNEGRRVPLAGRVAMDCLTVDLGAEPAERPGDIMTVWGYAPNGALQPVEDIAHACDTIAAELLTGLTQRVPLIAATGSGATSGGGSGGGSGDGSGGGSGAAVF